MCASTFATARLVDQRPLVDAVARSRGRRAARDGRREPLDELVVDARLDEDPVRADAGLPELRNFEAIAPSTATSRSASSKTISGALPPSSSETFFTVRAHCAISSLPDLGRAGERQLRGPSGSSRARRRPPAPSPCTTVKTPGRDAGARRRARPARAPTAASRSPASAPSCSRPRARARPCAGSSPTGSSTA